MHTYQRKQGVCPRPYCGEIHSSLINNQELYGRCVLFIYRITLPHWQGVSPSIRCCRNFLYKGIILTYSMNAMKGYRILPSDVRYELGRTYSAHIIRFLWDTPSYDAHIHVQTRNDIAPSQGQYHHVRTTGLQILLLGIYIILRNVIRSPQNLSRMVHTVHTHTDKEQ
jgi:hypothetical protein